MLYAQNLIAQIVPLQYKENKSFTYSQTIQYYQLLDKKYKKAYLLEKGITDIGKPLHLFVMYGGKDFNKEVIEKRNIPVLLIMNGIHPGEPDGIDASLLLAEWILAKNDSLLNNIAICIMPVYNIDGALNRSCCSRANQEGPMEYGFRGNAKNLDLNRDFIKMDTKNTESFVQIFQWLQPTMFIDSHVSNGANYQYTFTLLTTQKNKLQKNMSNYLYGTILPSAQNHMTLKGWPMAPFVNTLNEIPDSGITAFYDSPRYSSGYAALFNVPGFVLETHMLKAFSQRVEATLEFLKFASFFMQQNGHKLKKIKDEANIKISNTTTFGTNWKLNKSQKLMIEFLGYKAQYKKSLITGKDRLFYDTLQPYKKLIPMYWEYTCTDSVTKPTYYIIPQAWSIIIEKLKLNQVPIQFFKTDTIIEVVSYKIISFESDDKPYEGHHLKKSIKTEEINLQRKFYKGDVLIKTGTRFDYFLTTVLEPGSYDSYFMWGFFDSMLQQKEHFSNYVWEDKAYELLQENELLLNKFEKKKWSDTAFANNSWEQLYFIYKESPYFEASYMQYPIYKIYNN